MTMATVEWRRLADGPARQAWVTAIINAGAVHVDRAAQLITVTARCGQCDHEFSVELDDQKILAGYQQMKGPVISGDGELIDWSGVIRFFVACHCDGDHTGRAAATRHGCGAAGWFTDTP
jgi:hypothetical protein